MDPDLRTIAFAPDGAWFASATTHEIHVCDRRGATRFVRRCGAPVLAIAATPAHLVALDGAGRIRWWDHEGAPLFERRVSLARPLGFSVAQDGTAAVSAEDHVRLLGLDVAAEVEGGGVAVLRPDGERVVVLGAGGHLRAVDRDGVCRSAAAVPDAESVSWSPRGHWLVRAAGAVWAWNEAAPPRRAFALAGRGALTTSPSGALLAVRTAPARAEILSADTGARLATIRAERPLGDLAFGPGHNVLVAFESGAGVADLDAPDEGPLTLEVDPEALRAVERRAAEDAPSDTGSWLLRAAALALVAGIVGIALATT